MCACVWVNDEYEFADVHPLYSIILAIHPDVIVFAQYMSLIAAGMMIHILMATEVGWKVGTRKMMRVI